MRRILPWLTPLVLGALFLASGQQEVIIKVMGGAQKPALAVPDFRGGGDAAQHTGVFNETLYTDLDESGLFTMVAKSMFPLAVPQRPEDFRAPLPPPPRRKDAQPQRQGPWLTDWSAPPANASHLAFGYLAVQNEQLVLFGWLFDVTQQDVSNAQLFGKRYFGPLSADGARKVAHEFASDIIVQFGGAPLTASKIYFISDRTGFKEVWSMNPDGSEQKQLTNYRSICTTPAVSADGTRLAFTTYARVNPMIFIHSLETGRRLPFYNQVASMNATPAFTPDGRQVLYASTASGYAQIYIANADGSGVRRLSNVRAIEVEPKVSPKGGEVVFVSGRSGPQQIYKMNLDGANVERLTTGEGEASNPAWHPSGEVIAFAWTRGFEPGNWNLFLMDVASRRVDQLTHGAGRNENPSWAPDGRHLAFSSNRSGSSQIWTMLADGTKLRRLTSQGRNEKPVWGK